MRGLRLLFEVLLVGWLLVLAGCPSSGAHRLGEPPTEAGAAGSSSTTSTGDGGSGGDLFETTSSTGDGPTCAGVCKEAKPAFFNELTMWWLGPSKDAPFCPDIVPVVGSEGYVDPIAPFSCPSCSCAPAGCALPEHMHASAAKCSDNEPASVAWDSPGWQGACTAEGAIAPGLMCGGEPCTQSLTIGAASVEPCQPVSEGAEVIPEPAYGGLARECILGPLTSEGCTSTSEACVPAPPAGFTLCVHRSGDNPGVLCPKSYPYRYVVYAGTLDERSCAPCSCSDPQGAACSALVLAFSDGDCGAQQLASATVEPGIPACVDLPPGAGLGSKAAIWMEQTPGSCTPSGGPVGEVVLSEPYTLCCETEAYKPPE